MEMMLRGRWQELAEKSRQPDEAKLIEDLARGLSNTEAARRSGVSVRTVHRRVLESGFRFEVAEARREMIATATGRLASAAEGAVETLTLLLESESDSVRLGASRAILENLLRFREREELSDRVRQLEEAIESVGLNGVAV